MGVSCLFVAAKYEEIYPPRTKDYVYYTDGAYKENEVIQMEYQILSELDFNFKYPTCFTFMKRFALIANMTPK